MGRPHADHCGGLTSLTDRGGPRQPGASTLHQQLRVPNLTEACGGASASCRRPSAGIASRPGRRTEHPFGPTLDHPPPLAPVDSVPYLRWRGGACPMARPSRLERPVRFPLCRTFLAILKHTSPLCLSWHDVKLELPSLRRGRPRPVAATYVRPGTSREVGSPSPKHGGSPSPGSPSPTQTGPPSPGHRGRPHPDM